MSMSVNFRCRTALMAASFAAHLSTESAKARHQLRGRGIQVPSSEMLCYSIESRVRDTGHLFEFGPEVALLAMREELVHEVEERRGGEVWFFWSAYQAVYSTYTTYVVADREREGKRSRRHDDDLFCWLGFEGD